MRMYDIIKKKRDNIELTSDEINFFVKGYTDGSIPDYQAAALCMAIFFNGMNARETADLTFAVRDSGEKINFTGIDGIRVDKHSTGGVGDKTSLIVGPIVAANGIKIAKITGRGLGHTGGTVDKLESIDGFKSTLSEEDFIKQVNEIGIAMVGQSKQFAPADKKLYALRDVIATVDSMPLIVSSIMGKKLAVDDDCIVLDVKTGSGAFMKSLDDSRELARQMVDTGKRAGKKIVALITDMDSPLGNAVGNSLEVIEAIKTLDGKGPRDLVELCANLSAHMLSLAGKGSVDDCKKLAYKTIENKSALYKLRELVIAQGGDVSLIDNPEKFRKAKYSYDVKSKTSGYIHAVNTENYGLSALALGAGRNTVNDSINPSAGFVLNKKRGDKVEVGDVIATLYADDNSLFARAEQLIVDATFIGDKKPQLPPLVYDVID